MARVFIDGFGSGSLQLWDPTPVGTASNSIASWLNGTNYKTLPSSPQYYLSINARWNSQNSGSTVYFYNGTTTIGSINISPTGAVFKTGAGVTIATYSASLSFALYKDYEIYFKPHATLGECGLKIDGVSRIDISGASAKTTNESTLQITKIGIYTPNESLCLLDHVVIDNAGYPGRTKVKTLLPIGEGSASHWTSSTAQANYTSIDDAAPNDSDCVYTVVGGNTDLYTMDNFFVDGTNYTIHSLQACARAGYEGTTPVEMRMELAIGGTNYSGDPLTVKSAYSGVAFLWEKNPASLMPWAIEDIDNLESGYTSVI